MSSAHSARTSPSARAGRGSPVQGPQDTCTPGHAYSHSVSNARYSTCLPARSASHSRSPGAPTKISPDAYRSPNTCAGKALIQAEINTLTSTRVPSCLTELITLGKTFKRRATDILAYFDHPPHHRRPHRSNQRIPSNTYAAPPPGLPRPHQLHHQSTPRNRRIQTPNNTPIMRNQN